jgi:hypothetical protein
VVQPTGEIARRHRELVKVDEERDAARVEETGVVRARLVHDVFLPNN